MSTFSATPFGSNIADLYLPFDRGMGTAIDSTVSAVRKLSPDAASILDLGSGPGEPACTLAAAFPSASVICSDVAQAMVDLAEKRAKSEGLRNLSTMLLDLADLNAVPSASQDVITANFAIISTPSLESALREIQRVLKPGGFLVGTVWQTFSVPELAKDVMTELLGQPPPPPPIDPMRLADAALLDAEFSKADLHFMEGHNTLGDIVFDLGLVSGDSTWKSVMISALGKLEQLETSGDTTICERAKATVEKTATAKGLVKEGKLKCPGTFRAFRLTKYA
ncbi:hypothetical protein CYMTET_40561 [Cymbomonas tetramitiformis]|uniref:Methyltransferase domain-containing protein n=1 Tax=Cymbomonas tetramitiformis TaxID=36881 RepID=A0AAE0C7T5_9CHLO|nr:hypothetical protein CYMTET_40561 [Cymbomonas tetramitiformis]|eukprot:gene28129-34817_t